MVLNTCEMWFNGIRIASFFFKKIPKNRPATWSLVPRSPFVISLNKLVYLHKFTYTCGSPRRMWWRACREEEKDEFFHHFYSFRLLQERAVLLQAPDIGVEPLHSDEPLRSNLSKILGGLKGRQMSESKLPNKGWVVMPKYVAEFLPLAKESQAFD